MAWLGDCLGVMLLLGYPCYLCFFFFFNFCINAMNFFQEKTESSLHQGSSAGLEGSSR